jgi:predicted dehydrogenase
MKRCRIGIIGPGNIATTVASALIGIEELQLVAVASRDLAKAQAFKEKFNVEKAYGSYQELYQDQNVDLVYIATPHGFHHDQMMEAISYHKNILCEKAFCLNRQEAEEVIAYAKAQDVFIAEAMLPAYLSSREVIKNLLKEGLIGEITHYHGVFGTPIWHVERVHEASLGGGALLDIGLYPLYFALDQFGFDARIEQVYMNEVGGVDQSETIILRYPNRLKATITASTSESLGIYGEIIGTKGSIYIENIARPEWIEVRDHNHELVKRIAPLRTTSGYEAEFLACAKAIEAGLKETTEMPATDTLALLDYMDRIRWFHP